MNGFQKLKRQLLPLVKGLPIILVCTITALFVAKKVINYTPNTYQTVAKIKLDDQKFGVSNAQLYKDFDVFSSTNKIQSEAEILASDLLIGKALERVNFGISISRIGSLKNTLLYNNCPIIISHEISKPKNLDQKYWVNVIDEQQYQLGRLNEELDTSLSEIVALGAPSYLDGETITVSKNDSLLNEKTFQLKGLYECVIFSKEGLISDVAEKLTVTAIDKEIPVLRVVYKDQNAQKTADMANAICQTYISDYVSTKIEAASKTVLFLEQQIKQVANELEAAESKLEKYKTINGIVNTRQETETGLRQKSNLEVQLINIEMNEKAILELEEYLSNGEYFNETAVNFGFGDMLMAEMVKKLQYYLDQRQDMIFRYTEESNQVSGIDKKIAEIKSYIKKAITRNKQEIISKRKAIQEKVAIKEKQFDGLGTIEKEMRVLQRDFAMKEQVYTFLAQKKIEASIAASALLSFHRIIQPARIPKKPVSPNKTLLVFVSGLLGLIVGVAYVFIRKSMLSKIVTREDIEKHSDLPIIGVIRKKNQNEDFETLAKSLKLKNKLDQHPLITVSSAIQKEGKSYVSKHLANSIAALDYSVGWVDFSDNNDSVLSAGEFLSSDMLPNSSVTQLKLLPKELLKTNEIIAALKARFDVVLIDCPATVLSIDGLEFMKQAEVNLFLFKSNFTSTSFLEYPELLSEEYQIKNMQLLLNNAHMATNYNGRFVGTGYNASLKQQKLTKKFWNYITAYIRS